MKHARKYKLIIKNYPGFEDYVFTGLSNEQVQVHIVSYLGMLYDIHPVYMSNGIISNLCSRPHTVCKLLRQFVTVERMY